MLNCGVGYKELYQQNARPAPNFGDDLTGQADESAAVRDLLPNAMKHAFQITAASTSTRIIP